VIPKGCIALFWFIFGLFFGAFLVFGPMAYIAIGILTIREACEYPA